MTFLSKLAIPALALSLVAPVALQAQSSTTPQNDTTTMPQPKKAKNHHKTKSPGNTMNTPSQPMPDPSMQGNPAIAKPGVDPINPNHSPEPPVPTTQGPPPAGTTPNTNQVAPHL